MEDVKDIVDTQDNPEVQEQDTAPVDDVQKPRFNQIQMNDVVKREREKAFEKGRQAAMQELQAQQQQQQQPQEQASSLGGMQQFSQADIERMIQEQATRATQEHIQSQLAEMKQQQMVNSFVQKMQVAEQQYPGLEQELNQLNYSDPRIHAFIGMVNDFENTGEIMKEVLDNPYKLSQILSDIQDQPYLAQKNLQKLSASIKQNQQAKVEEAQARDPYAQLKPSTSAGMDNGSMSVADYRKMFKG
ncbi:MAG: hypothetical protein FGM16_09240 [Flavobacterium sp.]|nr:hypothetical protein [Flavobacterium sp.]